MYPVFVMRKIQPTQIYRVIIYGTEVGHFDQCFPTYGHMVKMGHGQFQVGHRYFIMFTGPQLVEWSIELLWTTAP